MRVTAEQKLEMVKAHVDHGKSLSHAAEMYGYDIGNLKYLCKLYDKFGEEIFFRDGMTKHQRSTKLIGIARVKAGESIRRVALDLGLIEPSILGDWVKLYDKKGEAGIKDSYQRASYLTKDQRAKYIVDQSLLEENERLRAELAYLKKSHSLMSKLEGLTGKQKAQNVRALGSEFNTKVLLKMIGMSKTTYYFHLNNPKINRYLELEEVIQHLFINVHRKRLGYQRIYDEVKKLGFNVGNNKVREIMRTKGFLKKKKKNYRKLFNEKHSIIKNNLMNQDFSTTRPYEKVGIDVSYFIVGGITVYLIPIIDFHHREVLAYEVGLDMKYKRVSKVLTKLKNKHGSNIAGAMIQSDQGIQFTNSRFSDTLKELGLIHSMSRRGNCYDNAPVESFFGRMKEEMFNGQEHSYADTHELINAIHEYIEYYNEKRPTFKLKMSPTEYRNNYFQQCYNELVYGGSLSSSTIK